jgi:aryl carrier-like protein
VVQRPATGIAALWDAVWPFDLAAAVGALGEARTRLYQEEAQRRDAQRAAPSFAEHVASLRVRCEVRLAGSADEARLFELAQRTNQFNTRAGRPSQEEVRAAVAGGRALAVFVSDRFGDYGLSGAVLLGAPDGDALVAERLLLSCRVLGRGVEETLVEALLARAREAGCAALAVPLDETPRNLPARRFLARHAPGQGGPRLRFAASFGPLQRHFSEQPEDEARAMVRSPAAPDWMEVARLTVDLRRLACAAGLVTDPSLAPVPPRPPAEGEAGVLEVLSEVLERPVRRGDNLYALGADSLRLVRVLARLKSRLGLDLPIGEVVHRADVADLLALAASSAKAAPPEDPGFNALIASLYDDAGDTGA